MSIINIKCLKVTQEMRRNDKIHYMKNIRAHFITVTEHRKLVREGCFRVGLYYQGLTHDLSKFSPGEFLVGVKYYQGFRSPNNAEREKRGYSSAWLHHKGCNKHHYEYWLDYSSTVLKGFVPARMPNRYIAEMYMDRVAASKTYNKEKYENDFPLNYFLKGKEFAPIEQHTKEELEKLLRMLADKGEEATNIYIRRKLLKGYPGAFIAEVIYRVNKRRQAGQDGKQKNA